MIVKSNVVANVNQFRTVVCLISRFLLSVLVLLTTLSLFPSMGFANSKSSSSQRAHFETLLTAEEKIWLKEKNDLNFSGRVDRFPYEGYDKNGEYSGILSDYLTLIQNLSGIDFQHAPATDSSPKSNLSNEVDLVFGDSLEPAPNKSFVKLRTFIKNPISIIMRKTDPPIESLLSIANQRLGVLKGYPYVLELKRNYPSLIFRELENLDQGLKLIASKQLDAFLAPKALGDYSISAPEYSALYFAGPTGVSTEFVLFVNAERAPLALSILKKAIHSVKGYQHKKILSNWSHVVSSSNKDDFLSLSLSDSDREYLRQISPLRFTGDPNWLPYEAFDSNGKYIGQVADHLYIIEKLLNIKFDIIPTKTWGDSLSLASSGLVDVISEADSSVLKNNLILSRPYTSSPVVIVMRYEENYVDEISSISDRKIAIVRDYGNISDIQNDYPYIDFVIVDTINDGLLAVSTEKVDALISNSAQALYHISRMGLSNVKIAGQTEYKTKLVFGVNPKYERFVGLLNKALDKIYLSSQQQEIFDRWNRIEYEPKTNYRLIYQIIAVSLFLFLIVFFWNYRLKREILQRKAISQQLLEAKENANLANEAKSKFLAVMSHELRTPLNGIIGLLELLAKSPLNSEQKNTIHIVQGSANNLLVILNGILDLSKIESDKLEISLARIKLKDILEAVINNCVQNAYDKNLDVHLYIDPALDRYVMADPLRIRQIIQNILNNAIKFTEYGSVSVNAIQVDFEEIKPSDVNQEIGNSQPMLELQGSELENEQLEEQELASESENKQLTPENAMTVEISVTDTGIGIAKENLDMLFKDFVQVDSDAARRFSGTGLGLSICKKLADLMGGEISVTSSSGKGSRFSYKQTVLAEPFDEAVRKRWHGKTVCVLTNDAQVKEMLSKYLDYYGAEIFIPFVAPEKPEYVMDMLVRENVDCLLIDEVRLPTSFEAAIVNSDLEFDVKLIKMVRDRNLSATTYQPVLSYLNINPIQPQSLLRVMDLCLNIVDNEESSDDLSGSSKVKPVRLMVVEDHPVNRELVSRQLTSLGYQYDVFENAELAIKAWSATKFDGVLTDCHMPVMDGYELAEQIRRSGSKNPIVAMTANAMSGELERCKAAGMDDLIVKPISLSQLETTLAKWFVLNDSNLANPKVVPNESRPREDLLADFASEEAMREMLEKFWSHTEDDIEEFSQAIESGSDYRDVIHRIKGAALTMKAYDLAEQCESLDRPNPILAADKLLAVRSQLVHNLGIHKQQFSKDSA